MNNKRNTLRNKLALVTASLIIASCILLKVEADKPKQGRRVASSGKFSSSCGTSEQVAEKIGGCLAEIFEIVEGKVPECKTDADTLAICQRFGNTERCVRNTAKDCLSGLHKTAVSSVSSATKRFRTSECKTAQLRSRYMGASKCAVQTSKVNTANWRNWTAIAQAIRDLPGVEAEQKVVKVCCLLNEMDRDLELAHYPVCPKDAPLIITIVHAMTEDARNLLCRSAKCQGSLRQVVPARLKQEQNFIEPVMEILFLLGSDQEPTS